MFILFRSRDPYLPLHLIHPSMHPSVTTTTSASPLSSLTASAPASRAAFSAPADRPPHLPAGASAPTRRPTPCPASSAPARRSVSSASGLLRAHPPVDQPPARLLAGLCPPPQCNGWKGGCGAAGGAAFFQLRPGQTVLESASPGRFSPRAVPPGITSQQTAPGAAGEVVPNAP